MRFVRFTLLAPVLILCCACSLLIGWIGVAMAQSTVADIVNAACSSNGALLTWLGVAAIGIIPAKLLTNIQAIHRIPVVGLIVNIVALNWRSWLRAAVTNAAKTTAMLLLMIVCATALTACGSTSTTSSANTTSPQQKLQADASKVLYYLQAAGCVTATLANAAAPVVQAVSDSKGNAVLSAIGADANVVCSVTLPAAAVAAAPAAPATAPATSG
jgi:hypothetical protein